MKPLRTNKMAFLAFLIIAGFTSVYCQQDPYCTSSVYQDVSECYTVFSSQVNNITLESGTALGACGVLEKPLLNLDNCLKPLSENCDTSIRNVIQSQFDSFKHTVTAQCSGSAGSHSCRVCNHAEVPPGSELYMIWEAVAKQSGLWNPSCKEAGDADMVECEGLYEDTCVTISLAGTVATAGMNNDVIMYQRLCASSIASSFSDGKCEDLADHKEIQIPAMYSSLDGTVCACMADNCNTEALSPPEKGSNSTKGNACSSNPCQNWATCQDYGDSYSYQCWCIDGYTGKNCEESLSHNDTSCWPNPCKNNGTCNFYSAGNVYCDCPQGVTGEWCETDLRWGPGDGLGACESNPCQYGGKCVPFGYEWDSKYYCNCTSGRHGYNCEYGGSAGSHSCRVCQHAEVPPGSELDMLWETLAEQSGIWNPSCKEEGNADTVECEGLYEDTCVTISLAGTVATAGMNTDVIMYQRLCASSIASSFSDGKCEDLADHKEIQIPAMYSSLDGTVCACMADNCNTEALSPPEKGSNSTNGKACSSNPCQNWATCQDYGDSYSYQCWCTDGYTGNNCEKSLSHNDTSCWPNPCKNNGTCNYYSPGNVYCDCPQGISGEWCETDLRWGPGDGLGACESNPCQYGGKCVPFGYDWDSKYYCNCTSGRHGYNCEYGGSAGSHSCRVCNHAEVPPGSELYMVWETVAKQSGLWNPSCKEAGNADTVECGGLYEDTCVTISLAGTVATAGMNNDVIMYQRLCASSIASSFSDGKCGDLADHKEIQIPSMYSSLDGTVCACMADNCNTEALSPPEKDVPNNSTKRCNFNMCNNGGSCYEDIYGGYYCLCPSGYAGEYCENEYSGSECEYDPCLNNGKCHPTNYGYYCACPNGYSGEDCQVENDQCAYNPCINGGICNSYGYGSSCDCPEGYWGKYCEITYPACLGNPCLNNGTCTEGLLGGAECECRNGFVGLRCEIGRSGKVTGELCSSNPCTDGFCFSKGRWGYRCQCPPDRTGHNCRERIEPSSKKMLCNETDIGHNITDCVEVIKAALNASETSAVALSQICSYVDDFVPALEMCIEKAFFDRDCDPDFEDAWKAVSNDYQDKFAEITSKCGALKKQECHIIDGASRNCSAEAFTKYQLYNVDEDDMTISTTCLQGRLLTECIVNTTNRCPVLKDMYVKNLTRLAQRHTAYGCSYKVDDQLLLPPEGCNALEALKCLNVLLVGDGDGFVTEDTSYAQLREYSYKLDGITSCDGSLREGINSALSCMEKHTAKCQDVFNMDEDNDWNDDDDWDDGRYDKDGDAGGMGWTQSPTKGGETPKAWTAFTDSWTSPTPRDVVKDGGENDWVPNTTGYPPETTTQNMFSGLPDIFAISKRLRSYQMMCHEDCPKFEELSGESARMRNCIDQGMGIDSLIQNIRNRFLAGLDNSFHCSKLVAMGQCAESVSNGCPFLEQDIAEEFISKPVLWQLQGICDYQIDVNIENPPQQCPKVEEVRDEIKRCRNYGRRILTHNYLSSSDACILIWREISCISDVTRGCINLIRAYVEPSMYDWIMTVDALACSTYGVDVYYQGVALKFLDSANGQCSFHQLNTCYNDVFGPMKINSREPGYPVPIKFLTRWLNATSGLYFKQQEYCGYFENSPNYDNMARCAKNLKEECMSKVPLVKGLPRKNNTPKPLKPDYDPYDIKSVGDLATGICHYKCKKLPERGEAIRNCSSVATTRTAWGLQGLVKKIITNKEQDNSNRDSCKSMKNVTDCLHMQVDRCPYLIDAVEEDLQKPDLSKALAACGMRVDLSGPPPNTEPPSASADAVHLSLVGIFLAAALTLLQ